MVTFAWHHRLVTRTEGSAAYRVAKRLLDKPLRTAYDLDIEGAARIPTSGPVIIAANHRSFMDSIFLSLTVPRPVAFLAKAEYFDKRRTAWLFRATGQIPVRRGSPGGARLALRAATDVLDADGVIGLYPEGTRSRDGLLHRGNLGAARLAIATGAPIVPVGLLGTAEVQPPDRLVPSVGKRVEVRFGNPIYPDASASDRTQLRDLTYRLMNEIAALCGQEQTDTRLLAHA